MVSMLQIAVGFAAVLMIDAGTIGRSYFQSPNCSGTVDSMTASGSWSSLPACVTITATTGGRLWSYVLACSSSGVTLVDATSEACSSCSSSGCGSRLPTTVPLTSCGIGQSERTKMTVDCTASAPTAKDKTSAAAQAHVPIMTLAAVLATFGLLR